MTGRFIGLGYDPHHCKTPGRRERRKAGIRKEGATWACDGCNRIWIWTARYDEGYNWYETGKFHGQGD